MPKGDPVPLTPRCRAFWEIQMRKFGVPEEESKKLTFMEVKTYCREHGYNPSTKDYADLFMKPDNPHKKKNPVVEDPDVPESVNEFDDSPNYDADEFEKILQSGKEAKIANGEGADSSEAEPLEKKEGSEKISPQKKKRAPRMVKPVKEPVVIREPAVFDAPVSTKKSTDSEKEIEIMRMKLEAFTKFLATM